MYVMLQTLEAAARGPSIACLSVCQTQQAVRRYIKPQIPDCVPQIEVEIRKLKAYERVPWHVREKQSRVTRAIAGNLAE